MKKLLLTGIAMLTFAISSCDEDTTTVGYTLTSDVDQFTIATDTFAVATRSIIADSVLARSSYSYLGRIRDPETGSYITCHYTTQFNILENEYTYLFPPSDSIISRDANELPIADSCSVNVIIDSFQGDSLAAMKLQLCELDTPIAENVLYYTNFDPEADGYLRSGGLQQNKLYTMANLQLSDSARAARRNSGLTYYFSIPLNKEYTDRDGNTYNNYGTYLMRKYYEHPEYFRNSINFAHHVCPGFYLKTTDGSGVIAEVASTQLIVNYRFGSNAIYVGQKTFDSTEEVLQTTLINNDKSTIQRLVDDNSCTYLKTPAGIFTEVTLPVDSIKMGRSFRGEHLKDTLSSARIVFQTMRETSSNSEDVLTEPTNLLMIERDSLYSFFDNGQLPNSTTSFIAAYNSTTKTYTFNNISTLINHMWDKSTNGSANWNKVVLIPVEVNTTSSSTTSTSTIVSVNNAMDISSVRLVGGSENRHAPVRISVIYNKSE
ncbi:MAG: DUF4270 domain-containing protein [Prevotella sp.]|nr:DUF4270 domain-containing protein [Prevotella sp.]